MRNLLTANFSRLKKDKLLWLAAGAMLIYTVYSIVNRYNPDPEFPNNHHWSNYYFIDYLFVFPLICALIIALYIGKDFDNKTVRNKAIAGYSKAAIYLSYLTMSFIISALIYIVMLIGGLVAIPLFGAPTKIEFNLALYILIGFVAVLSVASAYTFISVATGSRIKALIASIVIFFAVLFFSAFIVDLLWRPQFLDHHYTLVDNEWVEVTGEIPNTYYVGGTLRTVLEYIAEFFPTANALLIRDHMVVNPIREIALSLLFTVTMSLGGIFVFCKKDMK